MTEKLQINSVLSAVPTNPFLKCEFMPGYDPEETAREAGLFDFASTNYEMGARIISLPARRAFAMHVHSYAHYNGVGFLDRWIR
jgi:hypothetical protein